MIPELGHFLLWLALGVALLLGTVPLVGAARNRADWMTLARPAAAVMFTLVLASFACLAASFVLHDFSVPVFRLKQDAVPGKTIPLIITPTKNGEYLVLCNQLCGWGHTDMQAGVEVLEHEDFEKNMKAEF